MSAIYLVYLLSVTCAGNTINCLGKQSCKDDTIACTSNQPCIINCNGTTSQQACQAALINASLATDVTLNCVFKQDCVDTAFLCGTGRCDIICHGQIGKDDKQQCKFKSVSCGNGPCTIHCKGENSCQESDFKLSPSTTFNCIGYCPSTFPAPSVTLTPHHSPTASIYPTMVPSINPSIQSFASLNPSFAPFQKPINPSQSPTIFPTLHPIILSLPDGTKTPTLHPLAVTDTIDKNAQDNTQSMFLNINPLMVMFVIIAMLLICLSICGAMYLKKTRNGSTQQVPPDEDVQLERKYSKDAVISECVLLKQDTDGTQMEGCSDVHMIDEIEGELNDEQGLIVEGMKPSRRRSSDRECIAMELSDEFIVRGSSCDTTDGGKRTEGQ